MSWKHFQISSKSLTKIHPNNLQKPPKHTPKYHPKTSHRRAFKRALYRALKREKQTLNFQGDRRHETNARDVGGCMRASATKYGEYKHKNKDKYEYKCKYKSSFKYKYKYK